MLTTCQRYRPLLSAALDGETNSSEDSLLSQHLMDCPDCRQAHTDYRQLRQQFRRLSQPVPPASLRPAVMARLSDTAVRRSQGQATRPFRLLPFLSIGQTVSMGLAALGVLILGSLIVAGLLRTTGSSQPFEVQGQPVADTDEQKIIVAFSRPLDKDFVMANAPDLFSVKDGDGQALAIDFDHIKVDGDRVELPFKQEAARINENENIKVVVNPAIKDQSGTRVSNPGSKDARVFTPVPVNTAALRPTPTRTPVPATATATARATATAGATPAPEPANPPPTVAPAATTAARPTASPAATTAHPAVAATVSSTKPVQTTRPATATGTPGTPAATTSPAVSATPVQLSPTALPATLTPATPAVTITATVSVTTPTVVGRPGVTMRSDVCALDLADNFDKVYNNRSDIAAKAGCPTADDVKATLVYQPFQHGFMLWHKQSGWIYVFYNNGFWARFEATAPSTTPPGLAVTPGTKAAVRKTEGSDTSSDCTFVPLRNLGNIWTGHPAVSTRLGCALSPETTSSEALYQPFKGGLMFFNPTALNGRRIYAVYFDGGYTDLRDTSGD